MSEPSEEELQAMAVWENHMKHAGEKWKEDSGASVEAYKEGISEAFGSDEEKIEEMARKWREGIEDTSAEEFESSIEGEGSDWLINLYESVTGDEPSSEVRELAREIEQESMDDFDRDLSDEELREKMHQKIEERRKT